MASGIMTAEEDTVDSIEPFGNAKNSLRRNMNPAEPIAIVGMGELGNNVLLDFHTDKIACRWPGESESGQDVESPQTLWAFLQEQTQRIVNSLPIAST